MPGISRDMIEPGEPCWIIIDSANGPEGAWKGTIDSCFSYYQPGITKKPSGFYYVTATITDRWCPVKTLPFPCPATNYNVIPKNSGTDHMVAMWKYSEERIKQLRDALNAERKQHQTQIKDLTNAFVNAAHDLGIRNGLNLASKTLEKKS